MVREKPGAGGGVKRGKATKGIFNRTSQITTGTRLEE